MTLEQQIYDGDRAREVLENEAFQQVFADYRKEITEQWTNSPARAEADRERLWLYLSMLNKLEAMLKTTLETGKLRRLDLEHQRSMLARAKSLIGME